MYFVGIIDFLTFYDARKKFEYTTKYILYGTAMSVAPPAAYASRFLEFVTNQFE